MTRGPQIMHEYGGERMSVGQLAYRYSDLPADTVRQRLSKGWTIEKALRTPLRAHKPRAKQ